MDDLHFRLVYADLLKKERLHMSKRKMKAHENYPCSQNRHLRLLNFYRCLIGLSTQNNSQTQSRSIKTHWIRIKPSEVRYTSAQREFAFVAKSKQLYPLVQFASFGLRGVGRRQRAVFPKREVMFLFHLDQFSFLGGKSRDKKMCF